MTDMLAGLYLSGASQLFTHYVRAATAASLALFAAFAAPNIAAASDVTVFSAASLKNALDAIAADWQAKTGNGVAISYGSSSALAKQIEEGAPADVFLSAAVNWMDTLQEENLIIAESRRDLLGNTLVLVAHGNDAAPVELAAGLDLAGLLAGGKLAMAMVDSVPAGQYGKEALESLGLWAAVESSVVQAENVRAALDFVVTGEASYGIVYASDAIADDQAGNNVSVVATFPADSHKSIIYPGAVVASSANTAAQAFLDYLSSDAGSAHFVQQGFVIIE